jgi:Mg/Co/Ni transporter MgtE
MSHLSEQDRAALSEALVYDSMNCGDRATTDLIEALVARHVAEALEEAAAAIEADADEVCPQCAIDEPCPSDGYYEAARIVRSRKP